MDNLTHSITGFGAGELIHRSLPAESDPPRQRTRHRLLLVASALANNFPDLDLFLSRLLPDPLGYLLHHRGHTHTLLFALPQALLLAALLWLLWPAARALLRTSRPARLGLAVSVLLGLGLHLLMDYTNSYGVHPFYPFDGRWLYGDMVFIVEPLFWCAIGVPLALIMRWRWLRLAGLAALGLGLLAFAVLGFLGWPSFAGLLVVALACGAAQWRAGQDGRAGMLLALALCLGFVAMQGAASALGRRQISAALQLADPASRVLDVAMTAFPSQPLCWNYVSVEMNQAAGSYRLRRGVASVAPDWLAPLACPRALQDKSAARPLAHGVLQFSETGASLQALRTLKQDNCQADAWLRFGRAPALSLAAATLSDYRFAGTPGGNFTTLPLAQVQAPAAALSTAAACPQGVPGWGYPRADMLAPAP